MPHQEALTVIAEVNRHKMASLQEVLNKVRSNPAHNEVMSFGDLPECHFGRLLLLPAAVDLDERPIAPKLLLLTDCDGPADAHLESLVDKAGAGIDRLFGHCEDYSSTSSSRAERIGFLRRRSVRVKAQYVHRQGRTVEQIRAESELRKALQSAARQIDLGRLSAVESRAQLCASVRRDPSLHWALSAPPGLEPKFRLENSVHAVSLPVALCALGPVVVPAVAVLLVLIRLAEAGDKADHVRPSVEHGRELEQLEDFFAHSGFTAGGLVKAGWLRQVALRSVLSLIGYAARHVFTRGSLAGVKSIHSARWIPLDGGKRVVFASNYDGSVESYNNDFIDIVGWGLNLVFSNGNGYPKTRWLLFGGASLEQEFKDFLRCHQIPTPVWYSAYPRLSAVNIERNSQLRAGLRGRMNEREAGEWLRLL